MANVHAPQHTYPSAAAHDDDEVNSGYLDIALRDVRLSFGALASALLTLEHDKKAPATRGLRAEE